MLVMIILNLYAHCLEHGESDGYFVDHGYLFWKGKLCIPSSSIRGLLVQEAHEGRGHFGIAKTLAALKEHFFLASHGSAGD